MMFLNKIIGFGLLHPEIRRRCAERGTLLVYKDSKTFDALNWQARALHQLIYALYQNTLKLLWIMTILCFCVNRYPGFAVIYAG